MCFKNAKKILLSSCLLVSSVLISSCTSFFGDSGYLISDTSYTTDENGNIILTLTFDDENLSPMNITIPKGNTGETGNGIDHIDNKLSEDGNNVIITIYYTNEDSMPYEITVPVIKGETGVGIAQTEIEILDNGNQVLTITYTDGREPTVITIPRGEMGVGIDDISIEADDLNNCLVVTISFTDGRENKVFQIPYGKDGIGIDYILGSIDVDTNEYVIYVYFTGSDSPDEIRFPMPTATTWYYGSVLPSANIGKNGDFYFLTSNGSVYIKENDAWILYFVYGQTGSGSSEKVNHIVRLDLGGGALTQERPLVYEVEHGDIISPFGLPECTLEGYDFIGRYTDKVIDENTTHFTDYMPVLTDMTLYAQYEKITQ